MASVAPRPQLLIPPGGFTPAPAVPQPNIYPMEWRVEPPKLVEIYERSKRNVWNPSDFEWDQLDPRDFTPEQRVGIMYWYAVLANFDGSGPAVFAKATIQRRFGGRPRSQTFSTATNTIEAAISGSISRAGRMTV